MYDFYDRQLRECDTKLEALYISFDQPKDPGTPPPASRHTKPRENQAHFDLASAPYRMSGEDLTQIDGRDVLTVKKVLSEISIDMHKWPTEKHFASWLHLCPNNKITGGKVIHAGVHPTQNRASTVLRVAASSLKRCDSALGVYYRRIRARHRGPSTVTATAHKLARIIYFMLKERKLYHALGADYFEQQCRTRVLRNLNCQAIRLGFRLEPTFQITVQEVS